MKYYSSVKRNSGHHWSEGYSERHQSKSCVLYEFIYVKYPEKYAESRSAIAQDWSWKMDGWQAKTKGFLRLMEMFCVLTGTHRMEGDRRLRTML